MSLDAFLNGRDTISTRDAILTLEVDGKVIRMIECNKFSAKVEKNKEDVATLGTHWTHKKTTSVEGTGELGGYLINSNWLEFGIPYTQNHSDVFFNATLTIHDSTSRTGTQTVLFKDVNLDDIPVADFETDDGVMEWETDFSFEGIELITPFDEIPDHR